MGEQSPMTAFGLAPRQRGDFLDAFNRLPSSRESVRFLISTLLASVLSAPLTAEAADSPLFKECQSALDTPTFGVLREFY